MDSRTGELITAAQEMNGVYIWKVPNPLYFKSSDHDQRPFSMNHDIITLQIQFNHNLRKELRILKCFLGLRICMALQPQTGHFLRVFRSQVLKYLDNLGVISINNVVRAFKHVLYDVSEHDVYLDQSSSIKFYIY
ncbi:replication enhancer protein [Papaya leaf curl Lucknow virus 2]|uniref:Replication enhancer n=1 Tax=Papaya leaf curl Lucknow virus 2 TaxID=3232064 RepID=A0A5P1I927_9GEMI|nr:replication enhancer protein [Papaya severe leaf curl virus]QBP05525.1 replication enhancer protein [Papaya severe leaf curl virus]